ncbi:hypothetical protein [Enterovirga rhinocerotis]|uniref:Uncharacterized protein n=1 Tax=Enterovirga rhinocerotis TaxID=1339210 RepID=A0A4R7BXS7_9HYPH|nr:hypothetical protein [Enterovirga rhinocerotis]TDR89535.1 hypothetical protein EV668_2365 [Enterovirga rhinocerotis]
MLALAVLLATTPTSLDCIGADRKRSDLAVRTRVLLNREVDTGRINRAELGAYRAMKAKREWLLACQPEQDL